MIGAKRADAAGSEQVKSRFFFTVVNTSEVKHKLSTFRDPLGLDAFNRVVDQLRAEGFNVTEAKPGKACVAAFQVRFSGFEVCAILLAHRTAPDLVQCRAHTWCVRPLWRRVPPEVVSKEWIRSCTAIERALRRDASITSLLWLTEHEARDLEREPEVTTNGLTE